MTSEFIFFPVVVVFVLIKILVLLIDKSSYCFRCNVASLLMVALQGKMEYATELVLLSL